MNFPIFYSYKDHLGDIRTFIRSCDPPAVTRYPGIIAPLLTTDEVLFEEVNRNAHLLL